MLQQAQAAPRSNQALMRRLNKTTNKRIATHEARQSDKASILKLLLGCRR
jgi:hypothetical protein